MGIFHNNNAVKMNTNYESIPLDLLILSGNISHPFPDASSGQLIICRQMITITGQRTFGGR